MELFLRKIDDFFQSKIAYCINERLQVLLFWKIAYSFRMKESAEFRFESPISISKLNNYSDFGRKSENYFNVKIFSDSRPKSAQNLILKVFSDFRIKIICTLSKFFKNKIWPYTLVRVGLASLNFFWDQKRVWVSGYTVWLSLFRQILRFWSKGTPFACLCSNLLRFGVI